MTVDVGQPASLRFGASQSEIATEPARAETATATEIEEQPMKNFVLELRENWSVPQNAE
jgi:hypothetical protein